MPKTPRPTPPLSLFILFTALALLWLGSAADAQTYALGAASLVEGPVAGSDSVALTVSISSGAWSAAANDSWLHVTSGSASGAGSANVLFSFDANTGATRQGTFTIAAQTLTITQAAAGYAAATAVASLTAPTIPILSSVAAPSGVAVDGNGNVYMIDSGSNSILKYTVATQAVSTLVSGLNNPAGVAVDGAGNVYIADAGNNDIEEYTSGGDNPTLNQLVIGLNAPNCVAVDSQGNVYFNDGSNDVDEYTPSPQAVNIVVPNTSGVVPAALAVDGNGNIFMADTANNVIAEYNATSQKVSTVVSGLKDPNGVALDGVGNIYISDSGNNAIKEWIASTQTVATLVPAVSSSSGLAVDGSGNVYIADAASDLLSEYVAQSKTVASLASGAPLVGMASGVAVDASGNAYIADSGNSAIVEYVAASGAIVNLGLAGLKQPQGVAVDAVGTVYIADTGNAVVKKYTASAATPALTTLVSSGLTTPAAVAVDSLGNVYIADAGANKIVEYTGGSLITVVPDTAGLSLPSGLAVDGSGNLYIADTGNGVVKKYVAATQTLTAIVASGLSQPYGLALDGSGNLYIADYGNNDVKKYTVSGALVTPVGSAAALTDIFGVAVDASGDLFFSADSNLYELPRVFLNPATINELDPAGSDSLPAVVPSTFGLKGPFVPSSDAAWLSIGSISAGTVSFSFSAYSGAGRTGHIDLLGQSIAVTQGAPQAPVAATHTVFTDSAGSLVIPVLTDDVSPQGYTLTVKSITQPSFGKAVLNANGTVTYTPKASFANLTGYDEFTYTISDGHGGTATASVTILNPFESTDGTYDALLAPSVGGAANGYYTLSLTTAGSFTGSLKLAGLSYAFTGAFNLSGVADVSIKRTGTTPITGVLTLNLATLNNLSASFTIGGVTYTAATAAREQYTTKSPAPSVGAYTVQLPPPAAPTGATATATATVTGGKITTIVLGGGGSGYVAAPRIVITGAPGAGAAATAIVTGGAVTSFTINSPGAKYPAAGTVVTIDPPSAGLPQGTGWAAMTVSAIGSVTVAGKLGDGTAFTFGGYLAKGTVRDSFAFYLPLYSGISKVNAPGSLLGKVTFESLTAGVNSDCDGLLTWLKPAQTAGALYKSGFSTSVDLYGCRYTAPKAGQALIFTNKTAGAGSFQAGSSLSNTISVSSKNVVTVASPNADKLKLVITPATGLFSGSVYDSAVKLTYPVSGVLYQDGNTGVGLYLTPSQSGSVTITPQ